MTILGGPLCDGDSMWVGLCRCVAYKQLSAASSLAPRTTNPLGPLKVSNRWSLSHRVTRLILILSGYATLAMIATQAPYEFSAEARAQCKMPAPVLIITFVATLIGIIAIITYCYRYNLDYFNS